MLNAEATARMPFGGFFGRRLGERNIAGFTWARFVPNLRKREVRRHRHDEAHFVFVLRGNYETTARPVREASGPVLIYSPPGTEHRDCFVDEDLSQAAFATLSVSPAALAAVEGEAQLPSEEVRLPQSAAGLVRRIAVESSGQDDLSGSIAEALCIELLQRTGVERDAAASAAPAWLRRARELLRDSCLTPGPRSVREIARELEVHPVHLARSFRRHFDTTPGDYLRRCRLDHARSLLRRSQAGLADIAAATGFSDQSHFTNAFRKTFGVSPGVFRRS
jgi:AraC family transcriptional regulator